jgi:transcriptional regulator with XRE-family HTH domain
MVSSLKQKDLANQLGISPRQVRNLARDGMPVHSLEAARAWRDKNLDVTQRSESRIDGNPGPSKRNKVEAEQGKEETEGEIDVSQIDLEVTDADTLFKNARAVKEKSLALQAKAEHDLFIGTLVKRDDVERGISTIVRQLRDGLVNVSRRIAAEVSSLADAGECEKVIDREHRLMLETMSRSFAEKFDK